MYNLYLKKSKGKLVSLVEKPFQNEAELEKYLMETKEIFLDVFVLKRQVNAGRDIPDMIGVDRDNNIVIIENKNTTITEDILPQILRYAIWAGTNPDSIKAMWLETQDKPEDIEIDWDNVNIRLIALAPAIKPSVPRLLTTINYPVDLIEIKRFLMGRDEIILLHKLEEEPAARPRTARGLEVYDKKFYKSSRNSRSVDVFFQLADEVDALIGRKRWKLEKRFNKYYVGFKFGFFNVFGIHWIGSRSLELFFKMPQGEYSRIRKLSPYPMEYDKRWKQATIRYEANVSIKKLEKVFDAAYNLVIER